MDARKLVIVEVNEIPRRVVEDVADTGRAPFLARLLADGAVAETVVDTPDALELYPSQTWASLNTGVGYEKHGVYWYGDPKPEDYPFYWQLAASAGRSIGLVNTLHSSPVLERCGQGDVRFAIPDCFSSDPTTIPAYLTGFQAANASLTAANGRTAGLGRAPAAAVGLIRALPRLGLRPRTAADLAALVAGVATGRVPRERLRTGQFLLMQDLFSHLLGRESPDLGIMFTNHVAAAMHRYWYASYPDDFSSEHYDRSWIARYHDEIPNAVAVLDRYLRRLYEWCVITDRTLLVLSSMGQGPSRGLQSDGGLEAVVTDPLRFLRGLGIEADFEILGSMVPQITVECRTEAAAAEVAGRLANVDIGQVFWDVDGSDTVVTLTYHLTPVSNDSVRIGGSRRNAEDLGVQIHQVDDHSSGRHVPEGLLAVANSPRFKPPSGGLAAAAEVAPAILAHLGVEPAAHHIEPTFRI